MFTAFKEPVFLAEDNLDLEAWMQLIVSRPHTPYNI